jgi:hypothetical protein
MSVVVVLAVSACGLPGDGKVTRVGDDEVPYHLLDPVPPSPGTTPSTRFPGRTPVLYWLTDDRLVPEAAGSTCTTSGQEVVEALLAQLSAGPPGDVLEAGGGSAIPTGTPLALVSLENGLAEIQVDLGTTIAADRLPVAVGQIVLSVVSASEVSSVVLVSDGQRIQVPLPNGALTQRAVTALDNSDLVPARFREPGRAGCSP